jgi:hypothetical protein
VAGTDSSPVRQDQKLFLYGTDEIVPDLIDFAFVLRPNLPDGDKSSRRIPSVGRPRASWIKCFSRKFRLSSRPWVKGRDWYDFVWFAAYHPELRLAHLEQRLRQTGHWVEPALLTAGDLRDLTRRRIDSVDIDQIRREVEPFVKDPAPLALWSKEFFLDVASRIKTV